MKSFVEPTANYFFENNLISGEPQSIQLVSSKLDNSNKGTIYLKMIDNDNMLTEYEKAELFKLQEDLKEKVFLGANFEILACNNNFIAIE